MSLTSSTHALRPGRGGRHRSVRECRSWLALLACGEAAHLESAQGPNALGAGSGLKFDLINERGERGGVGNLRLRAGNYFATNRHLALSARAGCAVVVKLKAR